MKVGDRVYRCNRHFRGTVTKVSVLTSLAEQNETWVGVIWDDDRPGNASWHRIIVGGTYPLSPLEELAETAE